MSLLHHVKAGKAMDYVPSGCILGATATHLDGCTLSHTRLKNLEEKGDAPLKRVCLKHATTLPIVVAAG
jgi:hypothetical protein